MSFAHALRCRECKREFPLEATYVCDFCFGPLEVAYDYGQMREAVSRESIERRQAELDTLVKVRIPENIKEVAVARSYGDLRENFEFKAAKQMQAMLANQRFQLEKDLAHVQTTDFIGADTSAVNIGTMVTLADDSGTEDRP